MTTSVNGFGTNHVGTRPLTNEEFNNWRKYLPTIITDEEDGAIYTFKKESYCISTESIVILGLPIIPLKTAVISYIERKGSSNWHYFEHYYPAGKNHIYWEHVKHTWEFYYTFFAMVISIVTPLLIPNNYFWTGLSGFWVLMGGFWLLFLLMRLSLVFPEEIRHTYNNIKNLPSPIGSIIIFGIIFIIFISIGFLINWFLQFFK